MVKDGNSKKITKMDNNTEVWKDIENTFGMYQISNWGNLKSIRYNKILKPGLVGDGYKQARFTIKSNLYQEYVHRLVAMHFLPYDKTQLPTLRVNHKDLNKTNNHVDNLEFVSQKRNIHHFYETSKTLPRPMRKIVALDLQGNVIGEYHSMNEASIELKVSPQTVYRHCKGQVNPKRKLRVPYRFHFKEDTLQLQD